MNEIVKSIPEFFFKREPAQIPHRIDITEIALNRTNKQFEQAFIQVTGYGKEQNASDTK